MRLFLKNSLKHTQKGHREKVLKVMNFSGCFQGVFRVFSGSFQGVSGCFHQGVFIRVFSSGFFSLCPFRVCSLGNLAVQFFVCCSAAFGQNDVRTAEKRMLQCKTSAVQHFENCGATSVFASGMLQLGASNWQVIYYEIPAISQVNLGDAPTLLLQHS